MTDPFSLSQKRVHVDPNDSSQPVHETTPLLAGGSSSLAKEPQPVSGLDRLKSFARKYWFILGLGVSIGLAAYFPDVGRKGGYIRAEWSIKWGAVILIFLISGLSLKTQTLAETVLRVRLHFLIQIISLAIIPFFVFGLVLLLFKIQLPINSLLLVGVVIAASTPTTVSSNVVMTENAHGNGASALMNAALGNVLGIFISPLLVSVFQGPLLRAIPGGDKDQDGTKPIDFAQVLTQLGLTVLVPLIVGQIIQWIFPTQVAKIKAKCYLSEVSSIALLTMVWSVFSDTIYAGSFSSVHSTDMLIIVVLNAILYILFSILCLVLARLPLPAGIRTPWFIERLRYSREDTVAVMVCLVLVSWDLPF
ncbi:putative sodium bile acid cotransporter [Phycomyces nitens]|nr:putative sodium bile acid cotransporter [Phycomyces nitens]